MICVALRRNWATFKRMKNSLSIIVRVMIFTMFGILAITCVKIHASLNIFTHLVNLQPQRNIRFLREPWCGPEHRIRYKYEYFFLSFSIVA